MVRRFSNVAARLVLVYASIYFYYSWNPAYVWILCSSILFNYCCGLGIHWAKTRDRYRLRDLIVTVGVVGDLGALAYFKYANFFLQSIAAASGGAMATLSIVLPLGISFFTFTQIAYLVDIRSSHAAERDPLRYILFVTFFPHLVAGPILHHAEMMPQFGEPLRRRRLIDDLPIGLTLFILGLAKKILFADQIQPYAASVFDHVGDGPMFFAAWKGSLAYTLQLYFDFSGYSDMAIGLARCFGIAFPLNFDSPYQSDNIIEFWRRWHMTLSRFLRDYLYIPLGGNRSGLGRRFNLFVTMLLGGLWHGAAWTFVIWGGLHGVYLVINHAWRHFRGEKARPGRLAQMSSRGLTLLAVIVAWVFFRAQSLGDALHVLAGMAGLHGSETAASLSCNASLEGCFYRVPEAALWIAGLLLWALLLPNSQTVMGFSGTPGSNRNPSAGSRWRGLLHWRPNLLWAALSAVLFGLALSRLGMTSQFLYYQF